MSDTSRYKEAGVDLDAAQRFVDRVRPLVRQTFKGNVIADIGGFGGLFSLENMRVERPVLVTSTDGVGTKLLVAFMMDRHDTIGIDLVAMNVNDIISNGAKPLFFLDYLAVGRLDPDKAEAIVTGIVEGCRQADCSLIGGETAEMPDLYGENEYDLAGFVVGIVDNDQIIDGSEVRVGCQLVGLASSGLHSNGYTLVRDIFFKKKSYSPQDVPEELGIPLGEELLKPTRIYVEPVLSLLRNYKIPGIAHITGGGIQENLARVLPASCRALVETGVWEVPPIFDMIERMGDVSETEMYRTFNMGIGMVLVVREDDTQEVINRLISHGETPYVIGEVVARESDQEPAVEIY